MAKNFTKTPGATASRKNESRHLHFWYPRRCELPDCCVIESLQRCSACKMVQYCCKDHQREDWPEHKEECKLFQKLQLRATFYTDEDMLRLHPLQAPGSHTSSSSSSSSSSGPVCCQLCGDSSCAVDMTQTSCCNNVVCDTLDEYEVQSCCHRSHDRYTLCGYHVVDRECDKSKDWRECPKCTSGSSRGVADMLWRGLSSYNYYPLLSKDVPRHARCEVCDHCHKKFMAAVQGSTHTRGQIVCTSCYDMNAPQNFLRNMPVSF